MKVLQLLHSSHIFQCYVAKNIYVFPPSEADMESGRTVSSFFKPLFLHLLIFLYITLLRYIWRHIHLAIHKQCLYELHHLQGHFPIHTTFWGEGADIKKVLCVYQWLQWFCGAFKLLPPSPFFLTDCICNAAPFITSTFSRVSVPEIFHWEQRQHITYIGTSSTL